MGSMTSQIIYEYPCEFLSSLRIPYDESLFLLYCHLSYNEFSRYISLLHVFLGYCQFIGNILSDSSIWETHFFFFSNYHEGYLTIILIRPRWFTKIQGIHVKRIYKFFKSYPKSGVPALNLPLQWRNCICHGGWNFENSKSHLRLFRGSNVKF